MRLAHGPPSLGGRPERQPSRPRARPPRASTSNPVAVSPPRPSPMNVRRLFSLVPALILASAGLAAQAGAQDIADNGRMIYVSPDELDLKVGESFQLEVVVLDPSGEPEDVPLVFFTRSRGAILVDKTGKVEAVRPGEFRMTIRTATGAGERVSKDVQVRVAWAELDDISFVDAPEAVYAGTTLPFEVQVVDAIGTLREDVKPRVKSSNELVATVDSFGRLVAKSPGSCSIQAEVEGLSTEWNLRVEANPVRTIQLNVPRERVRTGDVVRFEANAMDASGQRVADAPVLYSFTVEPDDDLGQAATGQIEQDGRFVASDPGLYTIFATSGGITTQRTIRADARDVKRKIKFLGQGSVPDVHTSDLWVWEGVDGRDYAVTGTWGANGDTIFWDVTDPKNMEEISRVTVDARTVNDVKISEDGTLCVISREGASNRKNGIVLIDRIQIEEEAGRDPLDAVVTACLARLRPILMTSLSTLAGALPLMMASGAGSEARAILGVVIFCGVAFATLLTLLVVPTAYALLCRRTGSPEARTRALQSQSIKSDVF